MMWSVIRILLVDGLNKSADNNLHRHQMTKVTFKSSGECETYFETRFGS